MRGQLNIRPLCLLSMTAGALIHTQTGGSHSHSRCQLPPSELQQPNPTSHYPTLRHTCAHRPTHTYRHMYTLAQRYTHTLCGQTSVAVLIPKQFYRVIKQADFQTAGEQERNVFLCVVVCMCMCGQM